MPCFVGVLYLPVLLIPPWLPLRPHTLLAHLLPSVIVFQSINNLEKLLRIPSAQSELGYSVDLNTGLNQNTTRLLINYIPQKIHSPETFRNTLSQNQAKTSTNKGLGDASSMFWWVLCGHSFSILQCIASLVLKTV